MVNVFFWFIVKPTGIEDPVKTIVTRQVPQVISLKTDHNIVLSSSMALVVTTSMSLRIIIATSGSVGHGEHVLSNGQSA
jgi:hypothetical protein